MRKRKKKQLKKNFTRIELPNKLRGSGLHLSARMLVFLVDRLVVYSVEIEKQVGFVAKRVPYPVAKKRKGEARNEKK